MINLRHRVWSIDLGVPPWNRTTSDRPLRSRRIDKTRTRRARLLTATRAQERALKVVRA